MSIKKDILIKIFLVLFVIVGSIGSIFLGKILADFYIKSNQPNIGNNSETTTSIPLEIK